jgi:hypothetical protein
MSLRTECDYLDQGGRSAMVFFGDHTATAAKRPILRTQENAAGPEQPAGFSVHWTVKKCAARIPSWLIPIGIFALLFCPRNEVLGGNHRILKHVAADAVDRHPLVVVEKLDPKKEPAGRTCG